MPVHKRDRNFQNIVRDLSISSVPADYIQSLSLITIDGDKITFQGEDISLNIESDNQTDVVSLLIAMVEENGDISDEIADVEIIIDYKKLETDIADLTNKLLKANKNDSKTS